MLLSQHKHTSSNLPIQLGLCCLNCTLREQKPTVFASRKMVQKSIKEKGINKLKEKILQNLDDLKTMIIWNERHGIKVFRLSSEIFPHKTNPAVENYDYDFALEKLKEIGDLANNFNQRLTFHPGQFNVVGTPHPNVFKSTCDELEHHAEVLDLLGMGKNSIMVVHGGGTYGDKEKTKDRWCKQFYDLPIIVQKRLVIECCEKNFSVIDCLEISDRINIPVVFDTHHFECYKLLHPNEKFEKPDYYIPKVLKTWERRGIKPKFHVSEQGSGRIGHHSDYIDNIPDYLLQIPFNYGIEIDIMIEAKKKELAIFQIYEKYPFLNCLDQIKLIYSINIT